MSEPDGIIRQNIICLTRHRKSVNHHKTEFRKVATQTKTMRPIAALRLASVVGNPSHGAVTRRMASMMSPSLLEASKSLSQNPTESQQDQQKEQKRSYLSINNETSYNLCFLRHGQSTWNRDNRFIGWTDTPLTDDGVLEARVAGKMLKNSGILFDEVHTSLLRRCIRTTNLVLMEMEQEYIPVHKVSSFDFHMMMFRPFFLLSNSFPVFWSKSDFVYFILNFSNSTGD